LDFAKRLYPTYKNPTLQKLYPSPALLREKVAKPDEGLFMFFKATQNFNQNPTSLRKC
jgi:hypothetical protein